MLTWLLKLDPNIVLPVATSAVLWLWHKIAGGKAKTVEQIIAGAVRAILSEIAEHVPTNVPLEAWLAGARRYVLDARADGSPGKIWVALAKVGITKTPTIERLVRAAVEQATAELAHRIADERRKHNHSPSPSK